jgi:5-methylcytosine-specific restriction endonuclease McrA
VGRFEKVPNVDALPAWDISIAERREEDKARLRLIRQAQNKSWWEKYDEYLTSPEWRATRALVISRSNGLCEGCRKSPADQVHHLSYDHVGGEMLWELAAVCNPCHQRIHPHREWQQDGNLGPAINDVLDDIPF